MVVLIQVLYILFASHFVVYHYMSSAGISRQKETGVGRTRHIGKKIGSPVKKQLTPYTHIEINRRIWERSLWGGGGADEPSDNPIPPPPRLIKRGEKAPFHWSKCFEPYVCQTPPIINGRSPGECCIGRHIHQNQTCRTLPRLNSG